ncbi:MULTISPECIES: ABC transporter permease [Roseobacteraceae]|uniref:Glutathione transport system permease protein GsiC n=1 Tax=Pseudosulfitobacter pseudonitzschiae TaxID=1402135 RepID=A0A221K7K7_9RHOB|nr:MULTISPECIES: ABC transporter permease [Roseobacteraceae]ASM74984.1 glutathione transport system permease protein GsiC [Pseudosulfitobacter pseudonitzschiae]
MRYLFGRVQRFSIVLFAVTLVTFALVNILPGDVAYTIAGMDASEQEVARIRDELGLNAPLVMRYLTWVGNVFTGDWGRSYLTGVPVWTEIAHRLPISLQLMVMAQLIALLLALPAGLICAFRPNSMADRIIGAVGFATVSVPSFMTAILLIYLFSLHLGWLPATGYEPLSAGLWANLRTLILPALSLALVEWTVLMRILRVDMIGVLGENYISLARAKGMSDMRILIVHALRPSSFSLITILGLQVARLMSGTIILEQIFGIPGVGRLLVHAVYTRDFIVIQGCVTFFALAFVVANFIVDLAYAWLDPRVREARAHG